MNKSESPQSATHVAWVADAKRKLTTKLLSQLDRELPIAFADKDALGAMQIIVKQQFSGYLSDPESKLILAVEVQDENGSRASVVKIGDADQVGGDVRGWQACAGQQGIVSRLFIKPIQRTVGDERVAVIYPDVYQYFYDNGNDDEPKEIEDLVGKSIASNSPTFSSIERVLTQVYTEAHRCFYRYAVEDTRDDRIHHALLRTLRLDQPDSVLVSWQDEHFLRLRRGAAWLTCVDRSPVSTEPPEYIDPVDYVRWAFKNRTFPPMMVGPAHGDLHGRNIIAGSVRGEAEWPAVFDFDKMKNTNIVAWDFAKLEMELKCRLFQKLIDRTEDRVAICALLGIQPRRPFPESIQLTGDELRIQQRAERMEIMYAIEKRLLGWTRQLTTKGRTIRSNAEIKPYISTATPLGRALQIIFRIRREAAVYLGFEQQGRENRWMDEYFFALATYGVGTVKWQPVTDHLAWALLSAGVAAAALSHLPWPPNAADAPSVEDQPTYLHLLPYAHECWRTNRPEQPVEMLRAGIVQFPYAVALRQQLALSLAHSDAKEDERHVRREIQSLGKLACVFRDFEMLCRFGRIYKDRGDLLYDGRSSHAEMIAHKLPSYQHYMSSLQHYRNAYDVSDKYYPCVNAATMAMLVGDHVLKEQLANRVLEICGGFGTDREDQLWVLASEAEASLLLGKTMLAVNFYRGSLERIEQDKLGEVQSMYSQLCRLHWALGSEIVGPVVEMFSEEGRLSALAPGPFGNCGRG